MIGPVGEYTADQIHLLRKQRGWTQTELVRRLAAVGRTKRQSSVSHIEKGNLRVDVDDLVAFAAAFDVDPTVLLGTGTPPSRSELLTVLRHAVNLVEGTTE